MTVRELIKLLADENPNAEVQVCVPDAEGKPIQEILRGSHIFPEGNEKRDQTVFICA